MSRHVFKSHGSVTIVTFLFLGMVTGVILFAAADVVAETTATEARPRIGLVLSGGGARGLAHVGVIQILEEMKIPISCIA